ncbi:MAG: carboxylesterase family protein [Chitinophagaceae bacterium]
MKKLVAPLLLLALAGSVSFIKAGFLSEADQTVVRTADGSVQGVSGKDGVISFKGIPFAAAPTGPFRWREPQPVQKWEGIRKADHFGPRAMQTAVFGDMGFRSDGMNEDCLYLNVWTPDTEPNKLLPVLVYFYGGGFVAGDGSESRYDGASMARHGIVALTVNYRLGAFGFMAHPELTKESPFNASGNYGLLDQAAALKWVRKNISVFGGDPLRVTIAGESAGSISVSAQMASPLAKDLISAAIGESGSILGTLSAAPVANAEAAGVAFGKAAEANTLAELRAMPADKLLAAAAKFNPFRFPIAIDGYFFPQDPFAIYAANRQAQIPLLAGWNNEEANFKGVLGTAKPTKENFEAAVKKIYGTKADEVLKIYHVESDEDAEQVATDLAGDRFISFSTWKWIDEQVKSNKPVYRYLYSHPRPQMRSAGSAPGLAGGVVKSSGPAPPPDKGAVHSAEIEYAMGNLEGNKVFAWTADDHKVSKTMQAYFINFIQTHSPNGKGLPQWPAITKSNVQFININVITRLEQEKNRARYLFHDRETGK